MSDKFLYRLDLRYVGEPFNGWQSQTDGGSVQDHIEKVLERILSKKVRIIGASRTDSGVHAKHQVATFELESALDCNKMIGSMNALLPDSVGISSLVEVPKDFHPIGSSSAKVYRYQIWNARHRDPFLVPYVWHVMAELNLAEMVSASKYFIGLHDFSSFCASDSSAKTRKRRLLDLRIASSPDGLIECWFLGEGFLKQMVRSIVGTLVSVGLEKRRSDSIPDLILAKDRSKSGKTAPAHGLCLIQVVYDVPVDRSLLDQFLKC